MLVPQRKDQRRGLHGSQHLLSPMGRPTPKDSYSVQLDKNPSFTCTGSVVQQTKVALGNGGQLIALG